MSRRISCKEAMKYKSLITFNFDEASVPAFWALVSNVGMKIELVCRRRGRTGRPGTWLLPLREDWANSGRKIEKIKEAAAQKVKNLRICVTGQILQQPFYESRKENEHE